ncbi:hypothetical protein HME9302_02419 [Alteripontixanthobacter maritimus]|uniref:Uncharacterized protein n=1 Tax=Alteripontixanthobacter maritimus TaxID=2161824 RepID=A0A369QA20_9SPHN|nr:hypothetical protein [Alteripontixanthobacter maritimus]RDC61200.1 hypothetical protein HME9302_02419 [Alteripontixanthobacter maritimus]
MSRKFIALVIAPLLVFSPGKAAAATLNDQPREPGAQKRKAKPGVGIKKRPKGRAFAAVRSVARVMKGVKVQFRDNRAHAKSDVKFQRRRNGVGTRLFEFQ